MVIFTIQVISHLRFTKKLRENSRSVGDDSLLEQWNKMKKDMEIPLAVDIRYCSEIKTPLTLGMRMKNTTAYLPERSFTDEEAELIFAHELHHIRRRDTHMKFFLRFCCAFGWIHPLVWMAVRKAEDDLELSCDEIVLKDADKEKKEKIRRTSSFNCRGLTRIFYMPVCFCEVTPLSIESSFAGEEQTERCCAALPDHDYERSVHRSACTVNRQRNTD